MIMRVNVVLNRTVVVDNLLCTNSTPSKCNKTANLNVSLGKNNNLLLHNEMVCFCFLHCG